MRRVTISYLTSNNYDKSKRINKSNDIYKQKKFLNNLSSKHHKEEYIFQIKKRSRSRKYEESINKLYKKIVHKRKNFSLLLNNDKKINRGITQFSGFRHSKNQNLSTYRASIKSCGWKIMKKQKKLPMLKQKSVLSQSLIKEKKLFRQRKAITSKSIYLFINKC